LNHSIFFTHRPTPTGNLFRREVTFFVALFFLLQSAPTLRAATDADIKTLIAQLASDDPQLRQKAVDDLMGLKRSDLPTLRSVALSESPLLPVQISRLRQVVFQVFLAGEKFTVDSQEPQYPCGFLGVRFATADRLPHNDGIHFTDRIPGLPAYRFLHDGDVIVKFLDWPNLPLHDSDDFIKAVSCLEAGDIIRLGVLRFGRLITVCLPLDFRPEFISMTAPENIEATVDAWIQERQNRAENYWNQEFSAIDPSIVPDAAQASTSAAP